ncbi:hypothetical protein PA598K_01663 [Paenibacillus sp. 598K]|uniref:type IV pilus modification PilV family protein n=1 Tax=Paenibacillus sp. 598K TaxID=1117987 RepID=UPI000FFAE951|nr:type II secretion system protein [Paenibacillus sp. 598K]GBF73376.1 hypothetical protein PA598K_01663 [Paenibacillus sp. 598K]
MANQRGVTLIEVLGSVALLAVAVLTITYALQQTSVFSRDNDGIDRSVQVTRTIMEELRGHLGEPTSRTLELYGQTIDLDLLRINTTAPLLLYYPGTTEAELTLSIVSADGHLPSISAGDDTLDLDSSFKLITITSEAQGKQRPYTLEAYLEYWSID